MPFIFLYLLKLSLSLALVFIFYQLILRRLTFYTWNRVYLLGYTALSFFIAYIDISPVLQKNDWASSRMLEWVPALEMKALPVTHASANQAVNYWNIIFMVIGAGIFVLLLRLAIQLLSFRKMMKKAVPVEGLPASRGLRIYQVNESIIPFSFGRAIFINRELHSETELKEIIRHEFIHVKQVHSFDIIWSEIICLLNWYNPFAWLLRAAVRQNLEFIADQQVIGNGIDKRSYQYLLLKVIGNNQFSIASKFNFSSLKKRIAMMNKIKSARIHLTRFLFLLPLLAVVLLSFRKQITGIKTSGPVHNVLLPPMPVVSTDTIPDRLNNKGYYIQYGNKNDKTIIIVNNKDDKEVTWVYKSEWEKKEKHYANLYGELPPPGEPYADHFSYVYSKKSNLNTLSNDYDITDTKAVIHLKNGKTEEYDLTNPEQKTKFETKYGKIINVTTLRDTVIAPKVSVVTNTHVTTAVSPSIVSVGAGESIGAEAPVTVTTNLSNMKVTTAVRGKTVIAPVTVTNLQIEPVTIVDDYGYTITGKEDVLVTITKNTTPNELKGFIQQMKEKGIELKFDDVQYDNSIIKSISGTMKSSDGHSNFIATDFDTLILAMIKNGDKTYFKVSVKDTKKKVVI